MDGPVFEDMTDVPKIVMGKETIKNLKIGD